MTVAPERPALPFARPNVLELAPLYDVLRREAPVAAVTTPAGDPAWLVTRYTEVRDLLGDTRLGRSHPHPERAARITHGAVQEGPSGDYETEEADHTRMRRLLTPAFSAKRMRQMGDDVAALVDGYVDDLVAAKEASPDGVADLHENLAVPLPVAVICRLLGVPHEDADHFRDLSDRMATYSGDVDAAGARAEFGRYMAGLAEQKRAEPCEDVISDLVRAQARGRELRLRRDDPALGRAALRRPRDDGEPDRARHPPAAHPPRALGGPHRRPRGPDRRPRRGDHAARRAR